MKKRISGLFITYNPDVEKIRLNIMLVQEQLGACLVVDNGSNNIAEIVELQRELGYELVSLKSNQGIASAQNTGFSYLEEHHFDWVLTLDQDSRIPANMLSEYLKTNTINHNDTAILTSSYYDRHWTIKQKQALVYHGTEEVIEKKFVISSGNLVRISAWKAVGGFDEFLFIDMVDYDFDARLVLAGYKIWQVNTVIMSHAVGKVVHKPILEKILLLPETGLLADHPDFRQYYIYRNSIIFAKRYPEFGSKKLLIIRSFFATRRMFIYHNSFRKLKASWKGIIDGSKYKPNNDLNFICLMKKLNERSKL